MFSIGLQGRRLAARYLVPALLGAALLLTGCTDKLVEQAQGNPAPPITGGEQSQVVAQFDQDAGRVALPNDVVLDALNAQIVGAGGTAISGTTTNMPIRIPFSGPIQYPFSGDPKSFVSDPTALTNWSNGVFLVNLTTFARTDALPRYAGGAFKAVYQDENNDLVLVPSSGQLANETSYAVVVTTSVKDLNGNSVQPSIPMAMVRGTVPLVVSGHSTSSLVDDTTAGQLDQLRLGFDGIFGPLATFYSVQRDQVALMFTFTTLSNLDEGNIGPSAAATLAAGIDPAEAGTPADVQWFDSLIAGTRVATPGTAADFTPAFTASTPTPPVDKIEKIFRGTFNCVSVLASDGAGDYVLPAVPSPAAVCPNNEGVASGNGVLEFWLSKPIAPVQGIAVFQHGITRSSNDFIAVANTLANIGFATIAIDLWDHGTRIYQIGGANAEFLRPDDPKRTVGYLAQSRFDLLREAVIAKNDTEIQTALGLSAPPAALVFVGQSLGSIVGSLAVTNGAGVTFDKMLLSVPGGDVADIVLKGDIGAELIPIVSATLGQAVGSPALNSTLLGIELGARHAVFSGLVDPLAVFDPGAPVTAPTLIQEVLGDSTIANSNTELLSRVMALTTRNDGDGGPNSGTTPTRWIFHPANYSPATAGHGFLLDNATTATQQAQTQMAVWFSASLGEVIIDPKP